MSFYLEVNGVLIKIDISACFLLLNFVKYK